MCRSILLKFCCTNHRYVLKKTFIRFSWICIIILFHFFSSRIILRGNRSYCCACSTITVLAYGKSTCSFFQNNKMHLRVSHFFFLSKSARRPPVEGRRTGCDWGLTNTIHYNFWIFFFLDYFKNSFLKLDSRPLMWPNRTPGDHNFSKLESTLPLQVIVFLAKWFLKTQNFSVNFNLKIRHHPFFATSCPRGSRF